VYLRQALVVVRDADDRLGEGGMLYVIGKVLQQTPRPGDRELSEAVAYFDSASAVFATIRHRAGGDANAISLGELSNSRQNYEQWALAWLARGRSVGANVAARAALAATERGRAQALLNLLQRAEVDSSRAQRSLAAEADSLLAPLRASRTAALSYLVSGDTVVAWLVTRAGDVRVPRVPVRSDTLAALVAQLRTTLGADSARGRMARGADGNSFEQDTKRAAGLGLGLGLTDRDTEKALERLAAILLPPDLTQHVAASSELVIVPQGMLALVPFAALPTGARREPLGSRFALRYAPSFASLTVGDQGVTLASSRSVIPLVVGDPTMPWVRGVTGDSTRLRPLPAAGEEGQWVASRLRTQALSGVAGSETVVRRRLPTASIIHLATHGLAFGSEARVRDSYVALAPDSLNDGLLTMGELLDDPSLQLSADLVVLSACQTGLGDLKQAEGTVGLQRAFLAKGARTVLVSLWSVDDEATRLLMQRFYTHWLGAVKLTKSEALRRAQDDVRRTKGFEHPRYWAAFQLVGAR